MTKDLEFEEYVKSIQAILNTKIGAGLTVDGDLGPKTAAAAKRYQHPTAKTNKAVPRKSSSPILAGALDMLRTQVNFAWPERSKVSDGWIGDAAHAARTSDHNPWVVDSNGNKVVTAIDLTHDPKGGVDCNKIAELIKNDPRVKYLIWNTRIYKAETKRWTPYKGANNHAHHLHISVKSDEELYHNRDPWSLA